MCPACLTTIALVSAGAATTGGVTALAMRKLHVLLSSRRRFAPAHSVSR
jgi:hypothetical protein